LIATRDSVTQHFFANNKKEKKIEAVSEFRLARKTFETVKSERCPGEMAWRSGHRISLRDPGSNPARI
jgi:hypothetical protein